MSANLAVRNPRTGEIDTYISVQTKAELATLAKQIRAKQPAWHALGIARRIEVMQRFKNALQNHRTAIADALCIDTGRFSIAAQEVDGVCRGIDRWCAEAPQLMINKESPSSVLPHITITSQHQPYPLVGAISPWNFPLLLSFIDATPALLAGCAVMIKPSEVTPRFAKPVMQAIAEVPELQQVLHFVSGDGSTGAALIEQVDAVAFTGSVATGRKVAMAAAAKFIPAFLELGGKDPLIVLEGSDIDRASTAALRASASATGQACQSIERIYVHESLADEFTKLLTAKAQAVPLNFPDIHEGIIGPLIFAKQAEIINAHIEDAVKKGAVIDCGGVIEQHGGGQWIRPTVLSQVTHEMAIMREETFGPVMPVMSFKDDAEAIALANDSDYGLSGAVFGPTEARARAIGEQLLVGGISINDAGLTTMIFEQQKSAFRLSGMGPSRMGASGLLRFLRSQALYLNRGDTMPIEVFAEK